MRVQPNTPTASPFQVEDWKEIGDNRKFSDSKFLARVDEHGRAEPVCAEKGPALVGLGNLMRWNLIIHPHAGLEFA